MFQNFVNSPEDLPSALSGGSLGIVMDPFVNEGSRIIQPVFLAELLVPYGEFTKTFHGVAGKTLKDIVIKPTLFGCGINHGKQVETIFLP